MTIRRSLFRLEPRPRQPRAATRARGTHQVGGLLNLNTATDAELDSLPGIGPSLAKAIVAFREAHGSFGSPDELLDVPGIGPAKLAGLRDLVVCE